MFGVKLLKAFVACSMSLIGEYLTRFPHNTQIKEGGNDGIGDYPHRNNEGTVRHPRKHYRCPYSRIDDLPELSELFQDQAGIHRSVEVDNPDSGQSLVN